MSEGLKAKTLRGLFWSFFQNVSGQGVQFVIAIILARLLLPEQFGLIAMLGVFLALAQIFLDSGFGSALIQKQNTNHIDECSVFYFNIVVSFIVAGLLCITAPWIAVFYKQPLLTPLTRFLSLSIIISSFGLIQTTLMVKKVDFKTQARVSLISILVSGIIGITLAYNGSGVWSLAIQIVSFSFIRTALLWFFHNWRPSLIFSLTSLLNMFGFSSHMLGFGLINMLFDNIYYIIIGKLFSSSSLGYYYQAQRIQRVLVYTLLESTTRVTFPIFSSIQEEVIRIKLGMRKSLMFMILINSPIMIGLIVVAKPMVLVLFTEKWVPLIIYLQLFCIIGLIQPISVINMNLLKSIGCADKLFKIEVVKKILIITSIIVTYRWGIVAMIYGQIVVSIIALFINTYFTNKYINYSIIEQLLDSTPYLAISTIMGIIIYPIQWFPVNSIVLLIFQILTGVTMYMTINYVLKTSAFTEVLEICKCQLKPHLRV